MPLLEIRNLQLEFKAARNVIRALDGVSLSIADGQTLCLVGESGSGKSITALSIARLLRSPPANYVGGQILLEGRDTLQMTDAELRAVRGRVVSYVFQEPGAALNPVLRIGSQIKEALKLHRPAAATNIEVIRLLRTVGIAEPETRLRSYPHEMSGGMQQRVLIAMALASHPKLLVADEPTTALDVTIQAEIIQLLQDLKKQFGMAILLITHNLGIVGELGDHAAVMYAGQIVETGPARDLLANPLHPYTRALIESVPTIGSNVSRLRNIPGSVPQLGAFPSGCRFHPRCSQVQPNCSQMAFELVETLPGRWVRCPYSQ
jgi:oligopeptide/dipeptide ABC transporter ATP-binding protein